MQPDCSYIARYVAKEVIKMCAYKIKIPVQDTLIKLCEQIEKENIQFEHILIIDNEKGVSALVNQKQMFGQKEYRMKIYHA